MTHIGAQAPHAGESATAAPLMSCARAAMCPVDPRFEPQWITREVWSPPDPKTYQVDLGKAVFDLLRRARRRGA